MYEQIVLIINKVRVNSTCHPVIHNYIKNMSIYRNVNCDTVQ